MKNSTNHSVNASIRVFNFTFSATEQVANNGEFLWGKAGKINQRVEAYLESKANNPLKQNHKFPSAKYFYCLTCEKIIL